jgi:thioredoxin-related protein
MNKMLLLMIGIVLIVTSCGGEEEAKAKDEFAAYPEKLPVFNDFDEAVAYAKEKNRPLLVDFTGWACVNCRKMEENVWIDAQVRKAMSHYVLVSLYVDDKNALPEDQQGLIEVPSKNGKTKKKKIKTIGNKWATFEILIFRNNAQPYYIPISPDGKSLNHPMGYSPDPRVYADFLRKGLETFEKGDGESLGDIMSFTKSIIKNDTGVTNPNQKIGTIPGPVSWIMRHEQVKGNEYELIFTAKLDKGWRMYSQDKANLDGPFPTEFSFEKSADFEIVGKKVDASASANKWLVTLNESNVINAYDPTFRMDLKYFEDTAEFRQKIRVNDPSAAVVKGELSFMLCDASRCLPPEYMNFEFNLEE